MCIRISLYTTLAPYAVCQCHLNVIISLGYGPDAQEINSSCIKSSILIVLQPTRSFVRRLRIGHIPLPQAGQEQRRLRLCDVVPRNDPRLFDCCCKRKARAAVRPTGSDFFFGFRFFCLFCLSFLSRVAGSCPKLTPYQSPQQATSAPLSPFTTNAASPPPRPSRPRQAVEGPWR